MPHDYMWLNMNIFAPNISKQKLMVHYIYTYLSLLYIFIRYKINLHEYNVHSFLKRHLEEEVLIISEKLRY
jgi:hypothetical protein